MSEFYWSPSEQMARLKPYFPKSLGKPRVDDRQVLSRVIFVNRGGGGGGMRRRITGATRRCSIDGSYGAILGARSDDGGADCRRRRAQDRDDRRDLFEGASRGNEPACQKRGSRSTDGRIKGNMNTKLHAVTDTNVRSLGVFMTGAWLATISVQRHCWASCPKRNGCPPSGAVTPTGSDLRSSAGRACQEDCVSGLDCAVLPQSLLRTIPM